MCSHVREVQISLTNHYRCIAACYNVRDSDHLCEPAWPFLLEWKYCLADTLHELSLQCFLLTHHDTGSNPPNMSIGKPGNEGESHVHGLQ